MSDRHLRDSTSRLRKYYTDLKRRSTSKTRRASNRTPRAPGNSQNMAEPNNGQGDGGQAADPPIRHHIPVPSTPPAGGGDQRGQDGQAGGGDGQARQPTPPRPSPHRDMDDYIRRLQALEKREKEREAARTSRASSRASSRPSRPSSPRVVTSSRPSRRRETSDRRHDRRPSHHSSSRRSDRSSSRRGYTPTSYRSSSRRRRSRSNRRHRSRSPSRRRSRSRSSRRRSGARRSRSRSRSRSGSTRRSRSMARQDRQHQDPSPRTLRKDERAAREALQALEAQYPAMGVAKGKYLHRSKASLEPYRNLPPDLKRRAGERRSRRDLSLPEHICGLLSMTLKVMDPDTEVYAAIQHAAQVTQDAVTMRWPTVRAWSQSCLAHLEEGASWRDSALFKEERFRLSWCKGKSQPDIMIPCPAFNTATCAERSKHSGEGRTWLHVCAVCYYGINDTVNVHTSHGCRKKPGLRMVNDEGRNDNRRRYNNNNNQPNANKRDDKAERAKPKN